MRRPTTATARASWSIGSGRAASKEKAGLTAWLRALAPSDALRERFHHAAAQSETAWHAFRDAYFAALDAGGDEMAVALAEIDAAAEKGPVTLLFAAKDEAHNNAVALREWLERR